MRIITRILRKKTRNNFMKKRIIGLVGLMVLTVNLFAVQVFYVVEGGSRNNSGLSWMGACADVQTAIDRAASVGGGEVWIKKGTYKHGSAMTMKNNVAIYGGFAGTETSKDQRVAGNTTILDGEGSYRVKRELKRFAKEGVPGAKEALEAL